MIQQYEDIFALDFLIFMLKGKSLAESTNLFSQNN